MAGTNSKILAELVVLHRLTETEVQIAETRRTQATNKAVEREIAANARDARQRSAALKKAVVDLGGLPDTVGTVIGRANAQAKAIVEQAQTFEGALLSDLSLEHQLLDRALYLKALATTANEAKIVKLADRLESAHSETVQWIRKRLVEVAQVGPADLQPTPSQAVLSASLRLWALPTRQFATGLNRAAALANRVQDRVEDGVEDGVARAKSAANKVEDELDERVTRAKRLRQAAGEVYVAGRNAALRRSEVEARRDGDRKAAAAVRRTRSNLGALDANELPIRNYDKLTVADAQKNIEKLDRAEQLRAVLAYEEQNKARKSVVNAIHARMEELTKELATV